ncbi:MAG: penicillin-binding transpeptidase domain-containing protein, partial [Acetanaerobacterium sp.]
PAYRLLSQRNADTVKQLMINVVEMGSGTKANPAKGGAGGKTGSAQTGAFDDADEEIVHAWFAGFFPAEEPRYVVVVLNEGKDSGGDWAAPVFCEIADRIENLEARRAEQG